MQVAGVALTLVVLGHEGQRLAVPVGEFLGRGLEHDVVVGGAQHLVVPEGDLVLAQVALALGRLDRQPGAVHRVADVAHQRLVPAGAQDRVVDVVARRARQPLVVRVERLLEGVGEDDELQLRGPVGGEPEPLRLVGLGPQHLPRRLADRGAVQPREVALDHGRRGKPRREPQRAQVRCDQEVAVALFPRRDLIAAHGVHLDVHREQVVAALHAVTGHFVQEVPGVDPLALEPALHVREDDEHGVDLPGVDTLGERVEGQGGAGSWHRGASSRSPYRWHLV